MDDALHAALEVGLEGEHVTVGREGHELVLQIGQHVVLLGKILDLAHAALVQAAQFAAQAVQLGRAFIAQQAIVGNAAQEGRGELNWQGRAIGHGQQVRPAGGGLRLGNGCVGVSGKAQHLAQRPKGVYIGLKSVGAAGGRSAQHAADIGEGAYAENRAACGRAAGPVGGFLIDACGKRYRLCIVKGGNGPGAFPANAGKAQFRKVVCNAVKFKGVERAGVNHA